MSKEQPFSPFNENRRLLSPNSLPTSPQYHISPPPPQQQRGLAHGVRNVFKIVHGVGETVRGTILGALDNLDNRGEQKHHRIARAGQAEIAQAAKDLGLRRGEGGAPVPTPAQQPVPASWNSGAPATWSTFSAVSPTGADSKGTH